VTDFLLATTRHRSLNSTFYSIVNFPSQTELNQTRKFTWKIESIDEVTQQVLELHDISSNPTSNSSNLTLIANSLSYGLKKLTFSINITISNPLEYKNSQVTTYFRVIPTGINVYGLRNGIRELTVGRLQDAELRPADYSVDPDLLTSPASLSFKFYCKLVEKSLNYVNYVEENPSRLDLTDSATIIEAESCFSSLSYFAFDSTKNKLTIKAGALQFSPTHNNIFIIRTENLNQTFYQVLKVGVCGNYFNSTLSSKLKLELLKINSQNF
jgi:hypothetical protein